MERILIAVIMIGGLMLLLFHNWLSLLMLVASIAAAIAVGLGLVRVRNSEWSPMAWLASLPRRAGLAVGVIAWGWFVVAMLAGGVVGLVQVAGGDLAKLWGAVGGLTAGLAAMSMVWWAGGRRPMPSIFSVLSDRNAFDAFAATRDGRLPREIVIDAVQLAASMKKDVIGQDGIVDQVATTLARRARLRRPNKPLAVFMFVGSTGSGKTELAKAIAAHAFGGSLLRFDCNEMTSEASITRLVGSPPGYIDSDKGGQLTRGITERGSGVILFDEIEKAHPDVFKALMTLCDEGRITEASTNQVADASGFVILWTSNAEHAALAEIARTVSDPEDRRRQVKDTLQSVFRPEQLARLDDVFCFGPLSTHAQAEIVGKFLFRFAGETGVELVRVNAALLIDLLMRQDKQANYGIRELIRLVEHAVVDGMLEAKDAGFRRVAIDIDAGKVRVVGV